MSYYDGRVSVRRAVQRSYLALLLCCGGAAATLRGADDDSPAYDPPLYMHRHVVADAAARGALCNDGSPAVFYYRGCNETYYAKDAGGCVNISNTWLVSFESGGEYCYDAASCAARREARPAATRAPTTPQLVENGLTQPFPEVNPNFYKSHAVFVPYCSSDLWLGNGGNHSGGGFGFNGRNIIRAVLEDLQKVVPSGHDDDGEAEGALRYDLGAAESLLLAGGPGLAAQASFVASLLPANLSRAAAMLCDGCVVLDQPPLVPVSAARPCSTALDCPPAVALQAGWGLWGAVAAPECVHGDHRCLLAPELLRYAPRSLPLLVQHPLYDSTQLAMNRAWPNTSASSAYIAAFGESVRAVLRATPFAFGAGCEAPYAYAQSHEAYYYTKVNGMRMTGALSNAVSTFLRDRDTFVRDRYIDTCTGIGCNPSNCGK